MAFCLSVFSWRVDDNCPQEGDELINPCNTNLERKKEAEKMCGKIKDSVFRGKPFLSNLLVRNVSFFATINNFSFSFQTVIFKLTPNPSTKTVCLTFVPAKVK